MCFFFCVLVFIVWFIGRIGIGGLIFVFGKFLVGGEISFFSKLVREELGYSESRVGACIGFVGWGRGV